MPTKALPVEMVPVLVCEGCAKQVRDNSGHLRINLLDAQRCFATASTFAETPPLAKWHIWHSRCDPKPLPMLNPDYLIFSAQLGDANDLAKITADLMEQRWIGSTNWPATLRRILADTYRHADSTKNSGRKKRRNGEAGQNEESTKTEGAEND